MTTAIIVYLTKSLFRMFPVHLSHKLLNNVRQFRMQLVPAYYIKSNDLSSCKSLFSCPFRLPPLVELKKYIHCGYLKRLTALFFIMLFLFNLAGYRLFFNYLQEKADAQYELALDENTYDESQMITLKVDLDMPYLAENTAYERVDGEIAVDGKLFRYVKRKIYNGQLVLLCLPDEKKTKLRSSREEYFFYANNLVTKSNAKESAHKSVLMKTITPDYEQHQLSSTHLCLLSIILHNLPTNEALISLSSQDLPAKPPELV